MKKIIDKSKLDALIGMSRKYWYEITGIEQIKQYSHEYHQWAKDNFEEKASVLCAIIDAILPTTFGLKPFAINEDIYRVLETLGWTVE